MVFMTFVKPRQFGSQCGQHLGAVVVPVNTMSTRPELEYFISDAGCSLAIAWHELGPAAAEAAAAQGIPLWSLTEGGEVSGAEALK